MLTDQNIAERDKIVAHMMAGPIAVFRSGPSRGETVVIDHAQLAVFAIGVGLHQLFDDGRCLVSYFEKALRHMS